MFQILDCRAPEFSTFLGLFGGYCRDFGEFPEHTGEASLPASLAEWQLGYREGGRFLQGLRRQRKV